MASPKTREATTNSVGGGVVTTQVPGQMGPCFQITDKHGLEALKAILESQGASNLVGELHALMRRREVEDVAELFDAKTAGLVFGPAGVVSRMEHATKWGIVNNYTYHFAMTAIVYAMALQKLDPDFFREGKHSIPQDREGSEAKRQEIMSYVRTLAEPKP